jgi:ABC-type multidrug transport system fused ATPase/permease subunit
MSLAAPEFSSRPGFSVLDLYRQLFSILGRQGRQRFLALTALAALAALAQLVSVGSVFPLMALLVSREQVKGVPLFSDLYSMLNVKSFESLVAVAGTTMVLAILASNLVNTWAIWLTLKFVIDEQIRLSCLLMRKYAYKPYVHFLSGDSTAMSRDVLNEVGRFIGTFVQPLFDLVIRTATILVIGGGLILVNPVAALGSGLVFGGGYLIVYNLCRKRLEELGQVRIEMEIRKFKVTYELFTGQREARLLNCREFFLDTFADTTRRQGRAELHTALIAQLPRQGIEVLGFMLVFLLIMLFRWQGFSWQSILPMLSLYAVGAVRLMPQFQSLFSSLTSLRVAAPIVERLASELVDDSPPAPGHVAPLLWSDAITFSDITYLYPGTDIPVLDKFHCSIRNGEHVGFVGSTGAGKTTLINIVLGLLPPTSGQVLVDGQPLNEDNMLSWQTQIGFVPQDIILCNDTIAANIAFGIPVNEIDFDRLAKAADLACLTDLIKELPKGFHTLVGERGTRLSGGQRQRLGIARALYREPSILVLDEATSALDGRTEDEVIEAINKVGGDRTMIMIAHRLTTLKDCDRIFVLEKGRVVDEGDYQSLLAKNETFRSFAKLETTRPEECPSRALPT